MTFTVTGWKKWKGYAIAAGATALCTFAGLAIAPRFDVVNIAMLYLLAVLLVALRFGRGPTIATTVLSVAALDFVFVPPRFTLTVSDPQYLLTFVIMGAVGLVISGLRDSVRRQEKARAATSFEAETERTRSALLASISHDLRTPLAVMVGASSSLVERAERMTALERAALAQGILDHARKMSDHVAKLLQMTRLESGNIRPDCDWVALPELVDSALRRLEPRLRSHRVIVDLSAELPLMFVDAALIELVIDNLLENAAAHTPAGTIVRVRARRRDIDLLISVEDSGHGVESADAGERMFEKFQHGSSEGSRAGIGLGLAICRAIVTLHRGKIWAEALPDGGTAFRFTLAIIEPPSMPPEQ